jgi:hypothetical protein
MRVPLDEAFSVIADGIFMRAFSHPGDPLFVRRIIKFLLLAFAIRIERFIPYIDKLVKSLLRATLATMGIRSE